ncbi:hypothetical protein AGMMS49983_05270 [Clostridia bacterium]|nr:hypothetical protein AGMMS49983_05270 [Clostridia bacterium]
MKDKHALVALGGGPSPVINASLLGMEAAYRSNDEKRVIAL